MKQLSSHRHTRRSLLEKGRRWRWWWQNTFRQPEDILLALQVGFFLWTIPGRMERASLPDLLTQLRSAPRAAGRDRLQRLAAPWLRLPTLRGRQTCYTQALLFYRFLDVGGQSLRIHFLVEPGAAPTDRLRGHAWVTVDGEIIDPPVDPTRPTQEIYSHP